MPSPQETKRGLPDHSVGYGSPAALFLRRVHPCRVSKWARRSLAPPPFRFAVARFSAFHSMPEPPTTPLPTALLYCRMARTAGGERLCRAHFNAIRRDGAARFPRHPRLIAWRQGRMRPRCEAPNASRPLLGAKDSNLTWLTLKLFPQNRAQRFISWQIPCQPGLLCG